jgi:hypothetical protein
MFSVKYQWIRWLYNKYYRGATNKNQLHEHLEWLLERGENRIAKKLCPHCGVNPIKYLTILGDDRFGYSIDSYYSCCSDKQCHKAAASMGSVNTPTYLPIKFSSILHFSVKKDQQLFIDTLKDIFGFTRLNKQKVFEFFKADP